MARKAKPPAAKKPQGGKAVPQRTEADIEALCITICDEVAMGGSLNAVCKAHGIGESTFRYWVMDDRFGLAAKYARAREIRADVRAEEIDDIAQEVRSGAIPPDVGRVVIDAKKWSASKLSKRYSDRQTVEHAGSVEIKRTDLTPEERIARIAELREKLGI